MTCARRPAGARNAASPTSAGPRRRDARTGRARARPRFALPALALLFGALSLLAPGLAQAQETTAVSNHAKTRSADYHTSSHVQAQGFTTGSVAGGYTLTSIDTKYGPDEVNYVPSKLRAQVWSAAAAGGPGKKLADLAIPSSAPPGTVSFTSSGMYLKPSTKYYFVIYTENERGADILSNFPVHVTGSKSEDSGGLAGWSIEDSIYSQLEEGAPRGTSWNKGTSAVLQIRVSAAAAPSAPRNVSIVSGDDEVTLTWQVPSSWGTWPALGYSLELLGQEGWVSVGLLSNPSATTHTLVRRIYANLPEPSNGHQVRVRMLALSQRPGTDGTKNGHYAASEWVTTDRVTVGGPMAAPTNLTVTASGAALALSWTAPVAGTAEALTGYDVQYTTAAKSKVEDDNVNTGYYADWNWVRATHTGTTASATIGSLAASKTYRVRVRAKNTHGGGPWVFGTADTPAVWAPTSLSIKERNRSLVLSWTAPSGTLTGYDVHITSAAPWDLADDAAASGTDHTKAWFALDRGTEASPPTASATILNLVNSITRDTVYRVRVRAKTATNNSAWVFGSGTPQKPAVRFAGNGATVTEGGTAAITLSISYPIGSQTTIAVNAAGSGRYTGVPATVTLPATGTSAQVSITATDDSDNEAHERLVLWQAPTSSPPYSWNIKEWPVTILDNDPPLAPTVLAVSGGVQSLTATWEIPPGPVRSYEVQVKEAAAPDQETTDATPATGWDLVATVSKSPTEAAPNSVTIRGDLGDEDNAYSLGHGTAYHVRVRANDGQEGTGNGYSDWSAPYTGTTAHARTPDAPRFFRAEPNNPGELRVSWWAPNRGRDGAGLGSSARTTRFDLQHTSAPETEVPDDAAASPSGTDPAVAWINTNWGARTISGLQGVRHRLRVRYHNRFGAGAWAYTTGTPQAAFQTTAPTLTVPKAWVLPLNLRWEHPVPGLTPAGYHVHYTSAPATGEGAVADNADPVSGTDPAAGWVDAKGNANRVATTANGHNSWYAPTLKRGTEYRFRVRASYEHYVFHRKRPNRHSDWGYKTLVAGAGTAVGLFAFHAYESRALASVRINLANPVSHEVTVDYATSVPPRRAATPGADYLAISGTLTFEPGVTEKWLHTAITDDDIEDSGEQFVISLSNPRPANRVQLGSSSPGHGYHVHPLAASMTVTIYNHEAELTALAVETAPAAEGPWTALDFGAFTGGTTGYAATVPHATTHARLNATALHHGQRLRTKTGSGFQSLQSGAASGAIALDVGANALVVESLVSGERKTYTVTVTRQAEAPAAVAVSLSATPNPVSEGSPVTVTATLAEALAEDVTVPLAVTRGTSEDGDHGSLASIALPAGATSAGGTITTSEDADGDNETFTVALGTLPSELTPGTVSSVEVTISDSGQQRAVPLTLNALTGSTSTDGSTFGGGLDLGTFAAGTTTYTANVPHAVTHVKLTPTASAAGTTVQVGKGSSLAAVASGSASGAIALAVGANALEVQLSAAEGTVKTYTVTVTREARVLSSNANLSALSVQAGAAGRWSALDLGAFAAGTASYAAAVSYGTTHVRLTATAAHAGATLQAGAGAALAAVASGAAGAAIPLGVGANALKVEVTAEDGTKQTYTVTVTRAPAPPLTATFENVPAGHDGTAFSFALTLSDTPAAGAAPRAASFKVAPGTASVTGSGRRYTVTVTPKPANAWKDVTVTLLQPADCAAAGAICTADGRALAHSLTRTVTGPVRIRVEGARAKEGRDASLDFAVTLHRAAPHDVSVDYATADETATAGADYTAVAGTLTFIAGETAKTVSVPVLDDAIDEGREVMRLLLSNPRGAYLRGIHTQARGVIVNDDALQQAWLARLGRTVGGQVTDAVAGRLEGGLAPGAHATFAGQSVDLAGSEDDTTLTDVLTGLAQRFGAPAAPIADDDDPHARPGLAGGAGAPGSALSPATLSAATSPLARSARGADVSPGQPITSRGLLPGSAFHLALAGDGAGPGLAAWGRVAVGRFDGGQQADAGRLRLDGEVLTGTLGADADWGRVLAGIAVSLSEGEGAFADAGAAAGGQGSLESTMTTVSPYARFQVTERVTAWGLAGGGTGDMTIAFDDGTDPVRTGLSMRLGALGARGELLRQDAGGGLDLALRADAFLVRTESERAANSAATAADASRLRLVLEGGRAFELGNGATLRPALELGVRHDGGDAETGTGVEVGGSVSWAGLPSGLVLEANARILVAHADADYGEWGASATARLDPGEHGRGLAFTLSPAIGATSSASDRLWGAADARALAPDARRGGGAFRPTAGLRAEAGYGVALPGGFTGTPNLGFATSAGARDWRLGWRLAPAGGGFEVNLDAVRRETADGAAAEHGVMLRSSLRW